MARSNILNTRVMDFGELVGNGKSYRVPPYQRDYSWEEEHWEDLWSDITALQADDTHYMGAVVVEPMTDREFTVIDGQQRIATLSIVALAIIDRLETLARGGVEPERNHERAQALRRSFFGEKDRVGFTVLRGVRRVPSPPAPRPRAGEGSRARSGSEAGQPRSHERRKPSPT